MLVLLRGAGICAQSRNDYCFRHESNSEDAVMAIKTKRRAKSAGGKRSASRRRAAAQQDAIELLKADHRQVEEWFEQFRSTRSEDRKQRLTGQICQALKIHTQIEQEIFYPAFLEATGDEDVHHEAEIEHKGAQ
jgi:hypothetical protein